MTGVSDALETAARLLADNAEEQERASGSEATGPTYGVLGWGLDVKTLWDFVMKPVNAVTKALQLSNAIKAALMPAAGFAGLVRAEKILAAADVLLKGTPVPGSGGAEVEVGVMVRQDVLSLREAARRVVAVGPHHRDWAGLLVRPPGRRDRLDTESVARLSSRLATVAARVRELEARLTAQLAVTSWVGHDRDRFDGEWQGAPVRALRSAAPAPDHRPSPTRGPGPLTRQKASDGSAGNQ
jgi:hypothetical protein